MKLDLLANPPLNSINQCLLARQTQNIPPISQTTFKKNQKDIETLSICFGGESGGNFSFSSGEFLELFIHLKPLHIGFALSNHQQGYQAYKLAKEICHITPITPDKQTGIISSLPSCDVYIIPHINQDLLTYNPIAKLKSQILLQNPQALFIIDISYALARGEELDFVLDSQTIFLCDGESLGFLRGYGVFLSSNQNLSLFPPIRYVDGFYSALFEEITRRQNLPKSQDKKEEVFALLQEELQENVGLFAPLSNAIPNTLALRLKNIKARTLIQSLHLEGISAINGQECLFGLASPSFVLQEMGYTQLQSRELLSLSFEEFSPKIVKTLASHYKIIKNLEV